MTESIKTPWQTWAIIILVVAFLHALVLTLHLSAFWDSTRRATARMEVDTFSPAALEALQKKWEKKGQTFLQHSAPKPTAKETVQDKRPADYFSDRTVRVAQEQRARFTGDPRAGAPAKAGPHVKPLSAMGGLGIPLPLPGQPLASPLAAPGTPGGEYVMNKNLPEGIQSLLNSDESVYYSFYARLREQMAPLWENEHQRVGIIPRLKHGDYVSTLRIQLNRAGDILAITQLQSSGIPELDHMAKNTVLRARKFQNPPKDLIDPDGHCTMIWNFITQASASRGLRMEYLPPPY